MEESEVREILAKLFELARRDRREAREHRKKWGERTEEWRLRRATSRAYMLAATLVKIHDGTYRPRYKSEKP